MIRVEITGSQALQDKIKRLPKKVKDDLLVKVYTLTLLLEAHIKQDKLSGQVLHVVSGRLKRSIQSKVSQTPTTTTGIVYSAGNVPYAAIQEFGGTTAPHLIAPVKAQALAFMMNGKMVFAKLVHHPGSVIPERSYMRSGLDDMKQQIVREMTDAVRKASQI